MTASIRPTTGPAAASPAGPTHLLAGLPGLLSSLCAQFRAHPAPGVKNSALLPGLPKPCFKPKPSPFPGHWA